MDTAELFYLLTKIGKEYIMFDYHRSKLEELTQSGPNSVNFYKLTNLPAIRGTKKSLVTSEISLKNCEEQVLINFSSKLSDETLKKLFNLFKSSRSIELYKLEFSLKSCKEMITVPKGGGFECFKKYLEKECRISQRKINTLQSNLKKDFSEIINEV